MTHFGFQVSAYPTRREMGQAAAAAAAEIFVELLKEKETVCAVFAAAPSQNEMLEALAAHTEIDFSRVIALHMDEYIGLAENAPQSFAHYLDEHIFKRVPFKQVHYIRGCAPDADAECARYSDLIRELQPDIVCMGIGENGHIAFNDPSVADFHDPCLVKKVKLEEVCRMQQVHDGCFPGLEQVPTHALTLTIPALMSAKHHICTVPCATKAQAARDTVYGPIGEAVPATIMRLAPDARMFLDVESAALL